MQKILNSKDLMLKLLAYYCFEDTNKNVLITLHTIMVRSPDMDVYLAHPQPEALFLAEGLEGVSH